MVKNQNETTPKAAKTKRENRVNRRVDDNDDYSSCGDSDEKEPITTEEALEAEPDDPCHTNRFQRRRQLQRRLRSRSRQRKPRSRSRSKRTRR